MSLLKGLEATLFSRKFGADGSNNPGAETLITGFHQRGPEGLLAPCFQGDFMKSSTPSLESLGIDLVRASHLQVSNGRLTEVLGGIIT